MGGIFEALGEPRRRQILELLGDGEQSAGEILQALQATGPTAQPTVSQHLKVLREAGLVLVRADGTRRLYAIDPTGVLAAQAWLGDLADPLGALAQPLDALATEVARGKRSSRSGAFRSAVEPERRQDHSA